MRQLQQVLVGLTSLASLPFLCINCEGSDLGNKCEERGTCPESDASTEAGACSDPSTQTCAIDERYGVFVSAQSGNDANGDGSRENPYRTIGKALAAARAVNTGKKAVYACADGGSYPERLTIEVALDGANVYGGFKCSDWSYSTSLKAKLVSPEPNAITITNLTSGFRLSDFEVEASDATADGQSSIAVWVKSSQNVSFKRAKITAGKGANGNPGANGKKGNDGAPRTEDQDGKPPSNTVTERAGGVPAAGACASIGGKGGAAAQNANGGDGSPGTPNQNVTPAGLGNKGAGATEVGIGFPGRGGDIGGAGNNGANGAGTATLGVFSENGFAPASGNAGHNGFPGQGGGGGGASKGNASFTGASGGAGGMGGCGGDGGKGGGGGGASVALLAWQSPVTLENSELIAKDGGNAGKGGNGGDGGSGAGGGQGGSNASGIAAGGDGGRGGPGGLGGAGSGGTGGPSYALVTHGATVSKSGNVTLTHGVGGAKADGGQTADPSADPAPAGSDGASAQEYVQP